MNILIFFISTCGAFIVGCFVGFMIHMLVDVSAMRMGKAFFKKKDGRWYPFNPFRNQEPKDK